MHRGPEYRSRRCGTQERAFWTRGRVTAYNGYMRARVEWIVARTAFPISLVAALLGAMALMNRGGAPDAVAGQIILLSYIAIAVLERLVPLHEEWRRDKGDLKADIGLGVTNAIVNGAVQPLTFAASVSLAGWISTHYGVRLWPAEWPLMLQLIPALLIAELVEYSWHRSMHEIPWLWRIHATHHSANRLYWFNALRFHPIDLLVAGPGKLIPLGILGADAPVIALVGVFSAVHGVYQHANIPCRLGPLNWVFSMAELHRWHHSPEIEEANHNYGGNLIFWDIVFGTRYLPKDREPPVEIGIGDMPNFPQGFGALMLSPFRWERVAAEAGAAGTRPSDRTL